MRDKSRLPLFVVAVGVQIVYTIIFTIVYTIIFTIVYTVVVVLAA